MARIYKSHLAKAYAAATNRTTESIHKVTARTTSTDLPVSPSPATESGKLKNHRFLEFLDF